MKISPFILIGAIGVLLVFAILTNADRIDAMQLYNDKVTDCRPPGDEGERLVATLSKSADGGPLELNCIYHSTLSFAP